MFEDQCFQRYDYKSTSYLDYLCDLRVTHALTTMGQPRKLQVAGWAKEGKVDRPTS